MSRDLEADERPLVLQKQLDGPKKLNQDSTIKFWKNLLKKSDASKVIKPKARRYNKHPKLLNVVLCRKINTYPLIETNSSIACRSKLELTMGPPQHLAPKKAADDNGSVGGREDLVADEDNCPETIQ